MARESEDPRKRTRFRLEVEGELGEEWRAWFEVDSMGAADGRTVLELAVADQAELHGLLRRIHDLHLRLVSLIRTDTK